MINEVADRCDVSGGMKTWDGGAPEVVANNAETFGLQNLQTAIVG